MLKSHIYMHDNNQLLSVGEQVGEHCFIDQKSAVEAIPSLMQQGTRRTTQMEKSDKKKESSENFHRKHTKAEFYT